MLQSKKINFMFTLIEQVYTQDHLCMEHTYIPSNYSHQGTRS